MKSSLSDQQQRGKAPARILGFSLRTPAGAACAGAVETGEGRWSTTKAKASTKLGIVFDEDCRAPEPIPVVAGSARHFEPGAKRGRPPISGWLFPPAQGGNKNVPPIPNCAPGAGIGGTCKRKE